MVGGDPANVEAQGTQEGHIGHLGHPSDPQFGHSHLVFVATHRSLDSGTPPIASAEFIGVVLETTSALANPVMSVLIAW